MPTQRSTQVAFAQADRNTFDDTKRIVETLKKNGTVDNLHSQALNALFHSESFKAEVRRWLQQKQGKPSSTREHIEALQDMALSALVGVLAGTTEPQQCQQQQAVTNAMPCAAAKQQHQQPSMQQQQQQQPGSSQQVHLPPGPVHESPRQQQQQLQVPAVRQAQKRVPVNIPQEVTLKLHVALLDMLETEEKSLQMHFKSCYSEHMQRLQNHRPLPLENFTEEPPKDVKETPLSPKLLYDACDDDQSEHPQLGASQGLP